MQNPSEVSLELRVLLNLKNLHDGSGNCVVLSRILAAVVSQRCPDKGLSFHEKKPHLGDEARLEKTLGAG
jgi:hypothetical protein